MSKTKNPSEYTFKIIVIGDTSTGKSSFIQRYVFNKFLPNYKPTIGVDFVTKTIRFEDKLIHLQIWDVAGQERFGGMTRVYYKDAAGCLLLFDLSNYHSFESVTKWKQDLDNKIRLADGSNVPVMLVGNKSDLIRDSRIKDSHLNDLAKNFTAYSDASTKLNQNINESVNLLLAEIVKKMKICNLSEEKSEDKFGQSIKLEQAKSKSKITNFKCSTC